MRSKILNTFAWAVLIGMFSSLSFAATTVNAGVVPAITPPGSTVFIHTAVVNTSATPGPVTVTVHVTNPGGCVSDAVNPNAAALAFPMRSTETRFASLSMDIPQAACSGTYTVSVTVKNSITGVTFTKKTTFTVAIGAP